MQIQNIGKRSFVVDGKGFRPLAVLDLPKEEAQKLLDLYPNEVKALEVKRVGRPKKEESPE